MADAGLYIHVPFCARACPYCDFDFQVGRTPATRAFLDGLEREVTARLSEETWAEVWPTVYLGGGTPSLLGADGLTELGGWISRRFPGAGADEYTVEVNPEHATEELAAAIRGIGGTRVSLGVQTLDPAGLAALGRVHSAAAARAAIAVMRAAGLGVSADLIVGWPGQTLAGLADDVAAIVGAGAQHVSVYALTIEAGTPWETLVRRGRRRLPDPDHQADLLVAAESALEGVGLPHYEVASYGPAARHNLGYWTWLDYVGLGPSAHSARFGADGSVERRGNRRGLATWLADPSAGEREQLDGLAAAVEGLWTGLRYLPGVDVAAYLARFPAVDREWIAARTRRQRERGNLELTPRRSAPELGPEVLRVAPGRWLWHDAIAADLLG